MRIGIGTKVEEGKFAFTVAAPFLPSVQLSMERNTSEAENAPRYHFLYGGERCGAMWRRTPKGGGDVYLSGHLESPFFAGGKIDVAAFVSKDGGDSVMDLVWSVPRVDRSAAASQGSEGEERF